MINSFYIVLSLCLSIWILRFSLKLAFVPRLISLIFVLLSWLYLAFPIVFISQYNTDFQDQYSFVASSDDFSFRFSCLFLILCSVAFSIIFFRRPFSNPCYFDFKNRFSISSQNQNSYSTPFIRYSFLCLMFCFLIGAFISSQYQWTSNIYGTSVGGSIFFSIAAYSKLAFVSLFILSLPIANRRQITWSIILLIAYMIIDQSRTFFLQMLIIVLFWYTPNFKNLFFYLSLGGFAMVIAGVIRKSSDFTIYSFVRPFVGEFIWGSFSVSSVAELSSQFPTYPFGFTNSYKIDLFTPALDFFSKYININFEYTIAGFKSHLYSQNIISSPFAPLEGSFYIVDWFLLFGYLGIVIGTILVFILVYLLAKFNIPDSLKLLSLSIVPIYLKSTLHDSLKYFFASVFIFFIITCLSTVFKPLFVTRRTQ